MLRWIVIAVVALVAVSALGGSAVLASARDLPARAADAIRGDSSQGQSDAQMSSIEFVTVRRGWSPERVRSQVGAPEATAKSSVEGLELECWTYGIVGATGAFQLCFANGRLESRFRYGGAPELGG